MKIGIIGSGSIVENFILASKKIKDIDIIAIYSRNINSDRIIYLKQKYTIEKEYDNLENMFSDPEIDFIYIASPNSLHFEQSLMALDYNKNVICEKPFTSTKKEAELLFFKAKEKNLMIFEAIITIHLPNFNLIKNIISNIGDIKIVQLNYSQYSSKYDDFLDNKNPNVFNPNFSGGSLQDLNVYNIHFIINLFGIPKNYVYYPNKHKNGIDTSGILVMSYNNFVATLTAAKDSTSNNFGIIQGEKGFINIPNGVNGCSEIILYTDKKNTQTILNIQIEKNGIFYELERFNKIFINRDWNDYNNLQYQTLNVIEVIENSRKNAGIIFPADNLYI